MRTLLEVELDTETANRLITDGTLPKVMGGLMETLKPEAAYFYARDGRRCATFVVDLADEAGIPSLCEPFWLQLSARVKVHPCMNAEELSTGLGRLGRASF
ncbi:hypothetical protein ACFXKJ_34790 [Kitasatospora indigofera]|uniref:hypothetical protein n=1 Tax=Kitasatospora indigofera TaxID=67307 RepID=UPI003637D279